MKCLVVIMLTTWVVLSIKIITISKKFKNWEKIANHIRTNILKILICIKKIQERYFNFESVFINILEY